MKRLSTKKILATVIAVSMACASMVSVLAEQSGQVYTRIVYDFENEPKEVKLATSMVYKGYTPGGNQTLTLEDGVGINSSKAIKVVINPNDQTASNVSMLQTKRPFSAFAKAGDTVTFNVFVPKDAKINSLKISTKVADGYPERNQSSDELTPSNGLKSGEWNAVSMTIKDTTIWPSGELALIIGYIGDAYIYVDNLTVTGPTPNQPYEPYIGLKATEFKDISAMDIAEEMQPGWNLGNTMDMNNEGVWNNIPAEKEIFSEIKALGFNSVRIPMMWGYHMGPAPDYKVDLEWMDRCEKVTDWALESGLYVMINTHHDSGWLGEGFTSAHSEVYNETLDKFEKLWLQIADRMKNKSEKLIFETMNEVSLKSPEAAYEVNTKILNAIRKTGGYNDKRVVVLAGRGHNVDELNKTQIPEDNHIMVAYHDYGNVWDPFRTIYWGTDKQKEAIDKRIATLKEKYLSKNIPVNISEIGAFFTNDISTYKWYDYYMQKATAEKGILYMLWDDGGGDDNYDRKNKYWRNPAILQTLTASAKGIVNSFVNEDDIFVKAGNEEKDVTLNLELNGNTLVSISSNGKELANGNDYTVAGSVVTIKGNVIKGIVGTADYGLKGRLLFKFSQGLNSIIPVTRFNAPEIAKTEFELNTDSIHGDLMIPIKFNGCKLDKAYAYDLITNAGFSYNWTNGIDSGNIKNDDNNIIIPESTLKKIKSDTDIIYTYYEKDPTVTDDSKQPISTKIRIKVAKKLPEFSIGLPNVIWNFESGSASFGIWPSVVKQAIVGDTTKDKNKVLSLQWSLDETKSSSVYVKRGDIKGAVRAKIYIPENVKIESVSIIIRCTDKSEVKKEYVVGKDIKTGWNEVITPVLTVPSNEILFELKNLSGDGYIYLDDIIYGPEKLSPQPEEKTVVVEYGENFTLPTTHKVLNTDLSEKATLSVKWESKLDTSKSGFQRIYGKVDGYEGKAILNVIVKSKIDNLMEISLSVDEGDKFDMPKYVYAKSNDGLLWRVKKDVAWNGVIDTNKVGLKSITGKSDGFNEDVKLSVMVNDVVGGKLELISEEEYNKLLKIGTTSDVITVMLNGNKLVFDQDPIIKDGRTLVPMRKIFEAMGATVNWDDSTKTVKATKGEIIVTMQIGNKNVTVNEKNIKLDVEPQIVNGRTLVPARAVAESLNATVTWDNSTKTVIIK